MDKSIVAVEENHRRSDSLASASKSFGSIVQINSIAIDLSSAMEEIEPPMHEHFSIRGFVADMRRKDRKTCLPFVSEGGGDNNDGDLPPLPVPRFRWWQCSDCFPDIATQQTMLLTYRSDPGTSSCPHVAGEKDCSSPHSLRDIGGEHGSRNSINGEDNNPSTKAINSNTQCNGLNAATWIKEKTDVRNNEGGSSSAYIRKDTRLNNDADLSDMVRIAEIPSIRFKDPENASSGSDGACGALPHKRKPKLRSLADIMEEEKNSTSQHTRMRSAPSTGKQATSLEEEADSDPQLQLAASTDIAVSTRSPHSKRKIVEEDIAPLETTSSVGAAKRLKCPVSETEKTCKAVEVSDSESGGDRPARSRLQLSGKTQQMKHKRNKAFDTNRKMKQTDIDSRMGPIREVPKVNAVHSGNIHKRAVSCETKCGNTGNIPSISRGESAPYFNNFISGKQVDRISDVSRSKRPEVGAEHNLIIPPKKSFLGDFNVQGEVALDLSLSSYMGAERISNSQTSCRHRGIPDLNESFTEKPSIVQGKQLPTIPENRSSILFKNLDASCSKQIAREGKRQLEFSDPQGDQNIHDNTEHAGTSDDIPMEIVELLAKNQRERALENSRNHLLPENFNNSIGGSRPVYMDSRPNMINFSFTNARSGINAPGGKIGPGQRMSNFPQARNYRLDIGNQDDGHFSLFRPSQNKKTPFSTSNSVISGSRSTEGDDLLWPPRRKNGPLHLDVRQNRPIQPNGLSIHSFSDQRYKGKSVSDMNGDERRGVRDASAIKEARIRPSQNSAGSLDAYSNDTIPAMQLLSLMDRGIVSGSSFKVDNNSFLDKHFSPCNHHPRLNRNEKLNDPLLNPSFFSQNSHTKEFPTLLNGVRFSGETSKVSYAQGQMYLQPGNAKALHMEGPSHRVAQPSSGNPALEICTLNRNPADFSIPDAKNEFTISAKDLKLRKRNSLKERCRTAKLDGERRQKVKKDASGKELSRK